MPDNNFVTLDLKPFTSKGEQEAIDILKEIERVDKALTGKQREELSLDIALRNMKSSSDSSNVNTLLDGTGYQVDVIEEEEITGFDTRLDQQTTVTNKKLRLIKDGEAVIETYNLEDLKNQLNKDGSIFDVITDNAYATQKEYVLEYNKQLEEQKKVIKADKELPLRYYQDQFQNDYIKRLYHHQ